MKRVGRIFFILIFTGGLSSSLFLFLSEASADVITLKNGKDIRGLIVERHADRVIFSTEKGEIPILLSGIKNILYDDPEQNYMQIGRAYESENKYGEALAYYEKALEANPNFDEAKKAAAAMKSRFWAQTTEGPQGEMDKQQAIYDSWGHGSVPGAGVQTQVLQDEKVLHGDLGLRLLKKGDWVRVEEVAGKSDAAVAGLRRDDSLVAMDGESLRYLGSEVVAKKMLYPHYSSFTLEYERDCVIDTAGSPSGNQGLKLKLDEQGTSVEKVDAGSPADLAGVKAGDLVPHVNGQSTRYMPLGKVMNIIRGAKGAPVVLSVRRSVLLSRK